MGAAGVGQRQFRREQCALGVEHLEVAGIAVVVAQVGEIHLAQQRLHRLFDRGDALGGLALGDDGIAHLGEGADDGLAIRGRGGALVGRGEIDLCRGEPGIEQRHAERAGEAPGLRGTAEQVAQGQALAAESRGQRDLREPGGAGRRHLGLGGAQRLLRLLDVGATLQQVGRQPRGHRGRRRQCVERLAAPPRVVEQRCRRSPGQHGERALGLCDRVDQVRDLRLGGGEFAFGLAHVQLRGNAAGEALFADQEGGLARGDGAARGDELGVERAQLEVGLRHLRRQRQLHCIARIGGGEEFGARGGDLVADAPPQIDFPESPEVHRVARERIGRALRVGQRRQLGARRAGVGVDRRQLLRTGDAEARLRRVDPRHRGLEGWAGGEAVGDQLFEQRVVEGFPPVARDHHLVCRDQRRRQ